MSWEMLNQPIKKMSEAETHASEVQELNEIIKSGEEKKRRVLRFLENNNGWKIEAIVERFGLSHDVVEDYGSNGLVKIAFYADESMRIVCFELHMPYSEVLKKLK